MSDAVSLRSKCCCSPWYVSCSEFVIKIHTQESTIKLKWSYTLNKCTVWWCTIFVFCRHLFNRSIWARDSLKLVANGNSVTVQRDNVVLTYDDLQWITFHEYMLHLFDNSILSNFNMVVKFFWSNTTSIVPRSRTFVIFFKYIYIFKILGARTFRTLFFRDLSV